MANSRRTTDPIRSSSISHMLSCLLLAGSVNEVIEVVEDWEFSARLGADKANARVLRSELGDLIVMLPPG